MQSTSINKNGSQKKMNLSFANQFHFFIQKEVLEELSKEDGIKGVMGRSTLYIFPPGTAFSEEGVASNGKELVEIKFRYPNKIERKITKKAHKTYERDNKK